MEKAVIYARYSSHNQREESIEQQIAECTAYARKNEYTVVDIYSDSAQTGKYDRRAAYQRLRRDSKKGKFSVVIAYKSNRLARNMLLGLELENEMAKLGIRIFYVKEEYGDTAAGRFALRMMMNVNQFHSENMAEDIKRNQAANAKECRANGPAPFGYTTEGGGGRFIVDEGKAVIVQEIFSRVACGDAFCDIAADLNRRGIKTRTGGDWNKSSFNRMLHNERYMGIYIFEDVRIEGGMPEIISKELFYKVQDQLKHKSNPRGRHRENGDYLLTGKLYCGECGEHMIGMSGTSKSGAQHYYYACSSKRTGGGCKKKSAQKDAVEEKLAAALKRYVLSPATIKWMCDEVEKFQRARKDDPELKQLEDSLAETKKAIKNVIAAIDQGIVTPTTKEHLIELEGEQSRLSEQIYAIKASDFEVSREELTAWIESFRDGDYTDKEYQRTLFDAFLVKAFLYDDRCKIVFNLFGGKTKTLDVPYNDISPGFGDPECSLGLSVGSPEKTSRKRGFFNDVCPVGQMMRASHMMLPAAMMCACGHMRANIASL